MFISIVVLQVPHKVLKFIIFNVIRPNWDHLDTIRNALNSEKLSFSHNMPCLLELCTTFAVSMLVHCKLERGYACFYQ